MIRRIWPVVQEIILIILRGFTTMALAASGAILGLSITVEQETTWFTWTALKVLYAIFVISAVVVWVERLEAHLGKRDLEEKIEALAAEVRTLADQLQRWDERPRRRWWRLGR